jgi:hypothetical protein
VEPGDLLGVIDISAAFFAVPIHFRDWKFIGAHRSRSSAVVYTALPMGLTISPALFSVMTAESVAILRAHGIRAFVYMDDFLLVVKEKEEFDRAVGILQGLGWSIAEEKLVPPARKVKYLGVDLDLDRNRATIPAAKVEILRRIVHEAVSSTSSLTVQESNSLAGRLAWIAQVIPGASAFVKGLFDQTRALRAMQGEGWYRKSKPSTRIEE